MSPRPGIRCGGRMTAIACAAVFIVAQTAPLRAQLADGGGGIERLAELPPERQIELATTLERLRRSAVNLAGDVIATQRQINAIDERIEAFRIEESNALNTLDGQRNRLNRLAAGLQRLSRTPIEVWAIADGPSAELIRGALLLNHAMAPVEQEAENISQTIAILSESRARLGRERAERTAMASIQEVQMSELNRLVSERQNALDQLVADGDALTERLSELAPAVGSVGELILAIDDDDQVRALEARSARTRAAIADMSTAEEASAGVQADAAIMLPTAGSVETEFGAPDASGAPAQAIAMAVAPAALVVAPIGGVVRYAGPFADDGLILILDHGGGYHSIIAGVGRLDVTAGQAVRAGEPLAVTALPQSDTTPTSTLFFEVRRNGSPVNPMTELVLAQGRGPE